MRMRIVAKPYALSSAAHCSLALLPVSPQFGDRIPSHRCVSDARTDCCEYCQVRCFRKSAEKDCTVAQLMLARCYEQGTYLHRAPLLLLAGAAVLDLMVSRSTKDGT